MDVDIPLPAGLQLFHGHEELLVQGFVKFVENQASLGGDQGAVGVAVLLVADIHDGLALLVNLVQHLHEILLVVAVVAVAFCHLGIHLLQGSLHQVVHLGDRDLAHAQGLRLLFHKLADEV